MKMENQGLYRGFRGLIKGHDKLIPLQWNILEAKLVFTGNGDYLGRSWEAVGRIAVFAMPIFQPAAQFSSTI
jgi:hypothetical protein